MNACRFVAFPIALAFFAAPAPAAEPDVPAIKAAAVALVDRLAGGEFAKAAEAFDPSVQMTADKLRDDWRQATAGAGSLKGRTLGDVHVRGTGVIAVVRCAFADKPLDATLFCTSDGKVNRLVFLPPPLGGPGLLRAVMAEVFTAEPGATGTATFPVPGPYRDQVPVAFRVETIPPEAYRSAKLVRRDDGVNWLCEVTVAPPKDKVLVRWEALVLVGDRRPVALPAAAKAEPTAEQGAWLRPTRCVQCDDPTIKAKADELAKGTADVGEYAKRVIQFTTLNPMRPELFGALDARSALRCGSSCTGRANLAAALLRARGIPARTVAHLPTWSGQLFCHWLIEYWHPGAGWVWMEPTLNQPQPPPWGVVVVNVASPADEDEAFRWERPSGVMAGVPRRAARELSGGLKPLTDMAEQSKWGAVNHATPAGSVAGTDAELAALLAAARRSFGEWSTKPPATDVGRIERLIAAAKGGAKGLAGAAEAN